ncbi:molybdopterin-dependent oxidoreductase [Kitasatospora sp. MMS16-BH015]|uniref:molybdopterin-dependent oxidoreductase n=1 Tax=Kitasatospora sp. MMS16-BH015 TaxID=2018025 RepID=UPI0020C51DD3|nr:molybdopterin-dependent oxidoreductase [Kitasatospora sp. MMS16-BH015]
MPVEEKRGFCTLCKSRCGAVYTVTGGRITGVRPDPEHPNGAAMCPKGRAAAEIAHSSRRLTTPLRRTRPKSAPAPGWQPVSWEEAMAEIADRLRRIAAETGPESVAFAVGTPSGTGVADATEWIERLVRSFGSPNTVYSAEICNWHKDVAHTYTFGCALPPPDYESTELVLLWGFDPAKTWLSQSAPLAAAHARGAKVAVVDPRRSTSALGAEHWLRVRPGTDTALALALAHLLIEQGAFDAEFVRAWTNGPLLVRGDTGRFLRADELVDGADGFVVWDTAVGGPRVYDTARAADRPEDFALTGAFEVATPAGSVACVPAFQHYADACARWPADRAAATTWIPEREIRALAEEIAAAGRAVSYYCWSGVAQSTNASQTERALATLSALTGSFDAPGGNPPAPAPPYNSASGLAHYPPGQREKALGLDRYPLGPQASGYVTMADVSRAIEEADPYPVRALVAFGSNLVVAQPGSDRTARALRALDFQVHLDLFETPTSSSADFLLPVSSPYEREALRFGFESSRRAQEQVQLRPRTVTPQGRCRSDLEFVFDLGCRLGLGEKFFDGDIEAAWDWQLEPLGLTTRQLRGAPGGVRLPQDGGPHRYARVQADGTVTGFATTTRRVELYSELLADHGYPPVPEHRAPTPTSAAYPLVLTCAKHRSFVHSQHRSVASLRRRAAEPGLDLHPRTAAARGIAPGQEVLLSTPLGTIRMRARVDDSLHPGVVAAEYGWWQSAPDLALPAAAPLSADGSNFNRLVDSSVTDPLSGSTPLREAVCQVRAAPGDLSWAGTRPFTVAALETDGEGVRTIRLEPADGTAPPPYRPGQHIVVASPDLPGLTRTYSLTGPAREPDRSGYTIAVRHDPDGAFSTHVHQRMRVGDRLDATAPAGTFTIPTDTDTPVVMFAGGIGVTPFMSYLETLAADGGTVPEVVLHYGNATAATTAFRTRLTRLAARIPRLTVHHHLGPIPLDALGPTLVERRARFYLCGPAPMLQTLTQGLHTLGVPPFEVFTEKLLATRRNVPVPDDAAFTVRFARTGLAATWHRGDGTLLELGERHGVTMPSGCRAGQCESCACTVLDGKVAHLVDPSDDLPESGALTCQAVPVTDVVLDA